jgi:hypothetical protein
MNITNLITSIKTINGAVIIPTNDSWHYTPPNIGLGSLQTNLYKQPLNTNSIVRPIIDNEEAWYAIQDASDHQQEWGNEEKLGTDALAWYASFHKTNYWGIYVPYTGLLKFASNFLGITQNPDLAIQLAWDGLLAHESIHFGIDVACAQLEIISNSPIYLNGTNILRSPQGHIPDEEQIAEAAMLRFFKSLSLKNYNLDSSLREELFERMVQKSSYKPSGYRDGMKCVPGKIFKKHLNSYLFNLCHVGSPSSFISTNSFLELSGLVPLKSSGFYSPSSVNFSECPIYVFDDSPTKKAVSNVIHFITQISHIEESPGFMEKVVPKYLKQWVHTKELLGNPTYPKNKDNLDFKRWEDEDCPENNTRAWSVRVGKKTNMRAHIDEHISTKRWVARKFDNADKMGHHKNRK